MNRDRRLGKVRLTLEALAVLLELPRGTEIVDISQSVDERICGAVTLVLRDAEFRELGEFEAIPIYNAMVAKKQWVFS